MSYCMLGKGGWVGGRGYLLFELARDRKGSQSSSSSLRRSGWVGG